MTDTKARSPFATMIRRMLDESRLFTREEWRVFFDLQHHEIGVLNAWVTDGALPSTQHLRSLIRVLTNSAGVPPQLLADLHAFLDQRMDAVTPLHARRGDPLIVGWTVGHYAESPVLEGLLRMLHTRPMEDRVRVLNGIRAIIQRDTE